MDNFSDLKSSVVDPDFCVGCGTCVSMCNHETTSMRFNDSGKYVPYYINKSNCTSCGLCLHVCPFLSGNKNENDIAAAKFKEIETIKHKEETGYFLESYVGTADEKTRLNGASGGSLSQLLKWLLVSDIVDKVITVEGTNDPNKLFQYTIVNSVKDINRCAKSAYYPVEISSILKAIRKTKNIRYAIVGLPCLIKAVELAKQINPTLRKNTKFTIGLVCGQLKTKKYTDFLIRDIGIEKSDVESISFRHKTQGDKSSNFGFKIKSKKGQTKIKKWNDGIAPIWTKDFAKLNSCYYCDDVFAECADAAFMDAWLPEYTNDYRGTSLVINRSKTLSSFFESNSYKTINIQKIIVSQSGVLRNKRAFINLYSKLAKPNIAPIKRKFTVDYFVNPKKIEIQIQKYLWAQESRLVDDSTQQQIAKKMRKMTFKSQLKRSIRKLLDKLRSSK